MAEGIGMWQCGKCRERVEDNFEVCWNCGTSRDGTEDPNFRKAEEAPVPSIEQHSGLPPAPPRQDVTGAYEFTPAQNEVIRGLAWNMRVVGVVMLVAGGLGLLTGVVSRDVGVLVQGILALVIGGFTLQASGAFRQIVETRGNDIAYLMEALGAIRRLYTLQVILLGIAVVVLVLAFCVTHWGRVR
jgi:hypothetical protein